MSGFKFKTKPMSQQLQALRLAWPHREFAFFMEQGTGKSKVYIDLAAARWLRGQIDTLIVLCPNGVKPVWCDMEEGELALHCPVSYMFVNFSAGAELETFNNMESPDHLKVIIAGIEMFSQGRSWKQVLAYASNNKCMVVVDESSALKNHKSNRTANITLVGGYAEYRNIGTGTEISQGVQDLFGQFTFLNSRIIGCLSPAKQLPSFTVFKNKYCVMGGFKNRQVIEYQHTDDLFDRLRPHTYVVRKEDCLDLPDKVFEKVVVQLTKQQRQAIDDLYHDYETLQENRTLTVSTVLERLTRYQQIIGGTFPFREGDEDYQTVPLSGGNPKLDALMDIIINTPERVKVIIWARFIPEMKYIAEALEKRYGRQSYRTYNGATEDDDRIKFKQEFQDPESGVRFFISNRTGSRGLTLTAATLVVFYSNSFSYEDRKQSEDRCHRKGQNNKVTYIDLEAADERDEMILTALKRKQTIAEFVKEELAADSSGT